MVKKYLIIFTLIALALLSKTTKAEADTAGASAVLNPTQTSKPKDNRSNIMRDYLVRYNSPLAPYSKTLIDEADKNALDWKLIAAIAGNESQFGQMIPSGSYNGWGFGVYGNNVRYFSSWEEGIATVSKSIRTDYMEKYGAKNIYQIGSIYAADPAWAHKVNYYMNDINEYASNYTNSSLSISL